MMHLTVVAHGARAGALAFLTITLPLAAAVTAQAQEPPPPAPAAARPSAPDAPRLPLTLEDAVRRAVEHNPDLAIVRLGVDVDAARLSGSRSAFEPVFEAMGGRSGSATPSLSTLFGSDAISTGEWFSSTGVRQRLHRGGGTWRVSFDASRITSNSPFTTFEPALLSGLQVAFSQPLLRDRSIDAARHQYIVAERGKERSELRFRESVAQTVAAVKLAYWTLKASVAHVTVQQRSLDLAEDLVRQNRARVEVGQVPPLDLVQAEAEVAQRREALIRADTAAKDAEDRLRGLIMAPGDSAFWQVRLDPVDHPAGGASPDVERALASALDGRHDLARARRDLADAETDVTLAANQTLPDVRLEASYRGGGAGGTQLLRSGPFPGVISGRLQTGFADTLGQLFTNDFSTWSVGLTLSYPLGDSYEKANRARAEIERRQAEHRIASLERQIVEGLRQAARQVESTSERMEAARAGESLAGQRLDVERKRFDAGLSTTFLVTQAQRDLLQAQVNLLQATLDHQSSLVTFEAVQLAAPAPAGDRISLSGSAVIAIPTPTPRGVFRQGGS
jgi:outer membrane protein